jgi:hypothetical protein
MRHRLGPIPKVAVPTLVVLVLAACGPPPSPRLAERAYPAWGYKASFPDTPQETAKAGAPDGSEPASLMVETSGPKRDFGVWAGDVSRLGQTLDELASNGSQHVAQGMHGTLGVRAYAATAEAVDGYEYPLMKEGKWYGVMRVFLVNGRFYEVIAESAYGEDDPAVKDFLGSFHIIGAPPPAAPANAAAINAAINAATRAP